MDLFEHALRERLRREAPLAARMRPRTLEEFIGQEEIIGEGRLLRRAIETDRLSSSILLWGPPGSGKTTLASIIAHRTQAHFESISAVLAGIAELRRVIADARERRSLHGTRTTLFVDEVHRWNKAQQDALLPHVEDGTLTFVGATTENPYFEVIGARVSRSPVFQLRPLSDRGGRRILAAAPDAALYWLAKMLYAGESARFILRRLLILAGEDIGLADPLGLVVANAAAQAFEYVGLPEGIFPMVEATLYLATAPKSNSAGAYFKAYAKVEEEGKVDVPKHLQDSSRDAKSLGHGEGYVYPHELPGHHAGQQYLPTALLGTYFYDPSAEGHEAQVKERLARWRAAQEKALGISETQTLADLSVPEIV